MSRVKISLNIRSPSALSEQYRNVFRRGEALPEGNKAERDVKTSRPYASGNAVKRRAYGKVLISVEGEAWDQVPYNLRK